MGSLYFPVLRNKRAEWGALTNLSDETARKVAPIIEPLPINLVKEGEAGVCMTLATRMDEDWDRKIFLDPHNLTDDAGAQFISRLMRSEIGTSGRVIPVLRVDIGNRLSESLVRWTQRLKRHAVRIKLEKLTTRPAILDELLESTGLSRDSVSLIIDRSIVGQDNRLRRADIESIAGLAEYRDVVLLGGAFPKNLTGFKVGQHEHPRHEWISWLNTLDWGKHGIRPIAFGDYTIQHPEYEEPKAAVMNISASIRYAADKYWVIMRGEGVRNPGSAGFAQWPANAMMLVERAEYKGAGYSFGDGYIASKAVDSPRGTGNPETWLRAGINHHVTLTVRQLETIYGS